MDTSSVPVPCFEHQPPGRTTKFSTFSSRGWVRFWPSGKKTAAGRDGNRPASAGWMEVECVIDSATDRSRVTRMSGLPRRRSIRPYTTFTSFRRTKKTFRKPDIAKNRIKATSIFISGKRRLPGKSKHQLSTDLQLVQSCKLHAKIVSAYRKKHGNND